MKVSSPTGAMAAIYESRQDDLGNYLAAIPTADEQLGAAYAIGNSIVGLELFDAHTTYRNVAAKLITSYALDALEQSGATAPPIWQLCKPSSRSCGRHNASGFQ